jgi:hypothetical protein
VLKPQGPEQTWDAEHVIEMAMRQEQPIEPSEPSATPEQLTLSAFAAIDHDAMTACFHE